MPTGWSANYHVVIIISMHKFVNNTATAVHKSRYSLFADRVQDTAIAIMSLKAHIVFSLSISCNAIYNIRHRDYSVGGSLTQTRIYRSIDIVDIPWFRFPDVTRLLGWETWNRNRRIDLINPILIGRNSWHRDNRFHEGSHWRDGVRWLSGDVTVVARSDNLVLDVGCRVEGIRHLEDTGVLSGVNYSISRNVPTMQFLLTYSDVLAGLLTFQRKDDSVTLSNELVQLTPV